MANGQINKIKLRKLIIMQTFGCYKRKHKSKKFTFPAFINYSYNKANLGKKLNLNECAHNPYLWMIKLHLSWKIQINNHKIILYS